MKVHGILPYLWTALVGVASGYDLLEGFFKQSGACFDVYETPCECDTPLSRSFTPESKKHGVNEPTTMVYLFTPDSPEKAEPLHECGGRLPSDSRYDPDAETEVIIHGALDGLCRTAWMREMKEQIYQRGRYNVILVDWTWGNADYVAAGLNCRIVGEQVGFVINNIMDQTGVSGEKFHVVGHSFGAIASGYVGRSVRGLRRITGLDPAYAPYGNEPPNKRLTYRDAKLVDIIHTNGYNCFAFGIGDLRQLGHVDFYPNGGQVQAGCYTYLLQSFLKMDIIYALFSLIPIPELCSHFHALQYYKLSIHSKRCEYVGVTSSSYQSFLDGIDSTRDKLWAVMGMDYELYHKCGRRRRKFYLKTGDNCPYYDDSYLKGKNLPFNISCTS